MNGDGNRIVIAGGSGFLGRALTAYFQRARRAVTILTRFPKARLDGVREVGWNGRTVGKWVEELDGAAAVINLAGRSVNCRYHERNRRTIAESRLCSTQVLGAAIATAKTPPSVWLNASTATIYKHAFGAPWNESGEIASTPEVKDEFSVRVATEWEQRFFEAPTPFTRKVALRAALVLGLGQNSVFPALRRMVRFGLGGRLGGGEQFVSWIHQTDYCRAVEWLLDRVEFSGPVNLCAPQSVTNAEMMGTLRRTLGVPVGLPAAKWMLEVGAFFMRTETELVLKSRRIAPERLIASGFQFRFPALCEAIADLQKKTDVK